MKSMDLASCLLYIKKELMIDMFVWELMDDGYNEVMALVYT